MKKRADECGITVSKYSRKCTLGHQPKYHLTEREIEAEERQPLFSSAIFMRTWIEQITKLATELQNVLNKRKE